MPAINFCLLCGPWFLGWTRPTCLSLSPKLPHLGSHLRGAFAFPEASLQQELWDMALFSTQHAEDPDSPLSGDTGQA